MGVFDGRHPVTHGGVGGVFQGLRARVHGGDLGAQELHAEDVEVLSADVLVAHVNLAVEAEKCGCDGGRDAVLTRPGLRDEAALSHPLRQEPLAEGVVDLVCTGVVQVLALEVNLRPAQLLGQPLREIERRGASGIVGQQRGELRLEFLVPLGFLVGLVQLQKCPHQRLRDILSPVDAEVPVKASFRFLLGFAHSLAPAYFPSPWKGQGDRQAPKRSNQSKGGVLKNQAKEEELQLADDLFQDG